MHAGMTKGVAVLTTALLFASCASGPGTQEPVAASPVRHASVAGRAWEDSVLAAMSLDEKVGQLVMVTVPGYFMSDSSRDMSRARRLVLEEKVGSLLVGKGEVYAAAATLNALQRIAPCPLLVAADLEHGLAMRLAKGTEFPDPMAIGATHNPALAYAVGRITGEEAAAVGIRMNFAPVVDVNTNPTNPVINTRSYGEDLGLVDTMARAFLRGSHDAGVIATLKHFPGHGATGEDSHLELPVLPFSRARLDSLEFAAFRGAMDSGADAIMVGHIALPAIDPSKLPASLSPRIVTGVLRDEMGFHGLVVTDALGMAGARTSGTGRSAIAAINAGVDVVLLTEDEQAILQALRDAARDGTIPLARIDASARRVLAAKHAVGLPERRLVDLGAIASSIGTPGHWEQARAVAAEGLTLLRNTGGVLPLVRGKVRGRVVSLILADGEDSRIEANRPSAPLLSEPVGAHFMRQLQQRRLRPETLRLTPGATREELETALARLRTADLVLVSLFLHVRTASGKIGIPEEYDDLVRALDLLKKPVVVISFGDPYLLFRFPSASAVISAYSGCEATMEAAAAALFGERPFTGRLPVTIPGGFSLGTGLNLGASLGTAADTLRVAPLRFPLVDAMMQRAVADSVFPGAQLVVVRGDSVVLDHCYGRQTYDPRSAPVNDSTLYDLASLTKVVATTPALMRLYDAGRIDLDDPVGRYLPAFTVPEKRGITLRQLLMHRGGLPPFRRLWTLASTPTSALDSALATAPVAPPGDTTIYSDLGMIALGEVVRHVTGASLDVVARRDVFRPLGMGSTMFTPPASLRVRTAPTEFDASWRGALVQGTVHDENAAALGGVSGHAGLFSTAMDLARYAAMLLQGGTYGGKRMVTARTMEEFLTERRVGQDRWLGWDMWTEQGSSGGSMLSPAAYGHTGFTGTSLWIDPAHRVAVILLTNRVHPSRANTRLNRFRPQLHDAILRALADGVGGPLTGVH